MSGYLDQRIELDAGVGDVHTMEWTLTILTTFVVTSARVTVRNRTTGAQLFQLTVTTGASSSGQIVSATADATEVGFTDYLVRFHLSTVQTTAIGAERYRDFDVDVLDSSGNPVTAAAGLIRLKTAGVA